MKLPNQNKVQIEINKTNIKNIKEDLGLIRLHVTNHIPTAIKDIDDKLDSILYKLGGLIATVAIILQLIK